MRTLWIFLGCFLVFGQAHAGWVPVATVNEKTPGHLCDVDDNGLDLFCGTTNPEVLANGTISATAFVGDGSSLTGISTASADQVISGTTNITTNENSSISFTTAGSERMILTDSGQIGIGTATPDASAALEVSSTTQGVLPPRLTSTQRDNISNPAEGLMVFNTEEGAYQFWGGSNWVNLGGGIPNGTIAAFASASCPSGWTEYTPARGRFLRGIDPTGANDPAGVRTPGSTQGDMFKLHGHPFRTGVNRADDSAGGLAMEWSNQQNHGAYTGSPGSSRGHQIGGAGGSETRPVNVAVTFCEYTGGAPVTATPSGGAGEVQFADGSGGLSSNANFVYTGGNLGVNTATPQTTLEVGGTISTTSLFVNGTQITGGGGSDDMGNHTASQTLNLNGNWLSGDAARLEGALHHRGRPDPDAGDRPATGPAQGQAPRWGHRPAGQDQTSQRQGGKRLRERTRALPQERQRGGSVSNRRSALTRVTFKSPLTNAAKRPCAQEHNLLTTMA